MEPSVTFARWDSWQADYLTSLHHTMTTFFFFFLRMKRRMAMTKLKGKKKKNGEKTEALSMLWENEGNLGLFQQSLQSFLSQFQFFRKRMSVLLY